MSDGDAGQVKVDNLAEHLRSLRGEIQDVVSDLQVKYSQRIELEADLKLHRSELAAILEEKKVAVESLHDLKVRSAEEQAKHARHNRDHDKEISLKNDGISRREKDIHDRENATAQVLEAKRLEIEKLYSDITEATGLATQLADGIEFLMQENDEQKLLFQEIQKAIEASRAQHTEDQGRYGNLIDLKIKQLQDLDAEVLRKIEETKEPRATLEADQRKLDAREQTLMMYESRLRLAWHKYFPSQDLRI